MIERINIQEEVGGTLTINVTPINDVINYLAEIKAKGATHINMYTDYLEIIGIKYVPESDKQYHARVSLYENDKRRQEQAELVELARLKEKYEKKQ